MPVCWVGEIVIAIFASKDGSPTQHLIILRFYKASTCSKSIPLLFQVGLEKLVMTCGHGDKLGNNVCDFLYTLTRLL